jgi:hypothetical protein
LSLNCEYDCSICNTKVKVGLSYFRSLRKRNPELICRKCRLNKGVDLYAKLNEIDEHGRKCNQCKIKLPWDRFPGKDAKVVRRVGTCKDCVASNAKTRWYTDESFKKITQERSRKSHLKRKYGLTPEGFTSLLQANNMQCQICKTFDDLAIDHNHVSGKIRGILCRNCNKALGLFKDSTELLTNAVGYLHDRN